MSKKVAEALRRQGWRPPPGISKAQLDAYLRNTSAEAEALFQKRFNEAKARLNADAEFQRRGLMSREARGREATDYLAKELMDYERKRGNYISYEQAHQRIAALAHKHELGIKK